MVLGPALVYNTMTGYLSFYDVSGYCLSQSGSIHSGCNRMIFCLFLLHLLVDIFVSLVYGLKIQRGRFPAIMLNFSV